MEKLELQKRLEKRKAYLVCLMLFLILVTPTLLMTLRERHVSGQIQVILCSAICVLIAFFYRKMKSIKV